MSTNSQRMPRLTVLLLVMAMGVVFCTVHILNGWLLEFVEVTSHISLIYLPSFLRIVNVLVLGTLWGTLGTAIGGALLCFWAQDSLLLSALNTVISAASAALAVWCMHVFQQRQLSLTRLSDLMQLAVLNALLNALFHHAMWGQLDPSQLISPHQIAYMMIGDINGAIVGALGLRWLANRTGLVSYARHKVTQSTT